MEDSHTNRASMMRYVWKRLIKAEQASHVPTGFIMFLGGFVSYLLLWTIAFEVASAFVVLLYCIMAVGLLLLGIASWHPDVSVDHGKTPLTTAHVLRRYWPLPIFIVCALLFLYIVGWNVIVRPTDVEHRSDYLRTYFAVVGGSVVAFNLWLGYLNKRNADRTLKLTEDRQVNELFYQATQQLGDSSEARRIGGLFTLERIANTSDEFYEQSIEVICAFLRSPTVQCETPDPLPPSFKMPEDIKVAWLILARRRKAAGLGENSILNLAGSKAIGVLFEKADFCLADLRGADFREAQLVDCRFQEAVLHKADFSRSLWRNTDFSLCVTYDVKTENVKLYYGGVPKFRWPPLLAEALSEKNADLFIAASPATRDWRPIPVEGTTIRMCMPQGRIDESLLESINKEERNFLRGFRDVPPEGTVMYWTQPV